MHAQDLHDLSHALRRDYVAGRIEQDEFEGCTADLRQRFDEELAAELSAGRSITVLQCDWDDCGAMDGPELPQWVILAGCAVMAVFVAVAAWMNW